ncbi:MAG: helix-turn-helix transcriptional regulator [Acidobacteriota bacterium]
MAPRSLRNAHRQPLTPRPKPKPKTSVEVLTVTIGNRLKEVLEEKDISQAACAKRIAISRRQFSRLVAGGAPKIDLAYLLEAVLETPVHELFPRTFSTRRARP